MTNRKIKHLVLIDDPDGSRVDYYPNWLPFKDSLKLFDELKRSLPLEIKQITLFGQQVDQPRLTSWHGDPNKSYTYSKLTVTPEPWTPELSFIKNKLNEFLGYNFNSVLANYYRDGQDSIAPHSDAENELGPSKHNRVIASVSLGEARNFCLRHKTNKTVTQLDLQFGSLLVMSGTTQQHYTHEVAKTKKEVKDRLNLTYRIII